MATEAFEALTRLDKTGYQWLSQVSKAIQVHNNNGHADIAAEMIRHARSVMEPWAYIQWLSRTIPTPTRDVHWVTTLVQWLPYDWTDDEELMRHMLHAMAPADSEQVWLELCVREVLNDHTIQQNPEMLDIHIQYLSKVKKWSRRAPPQIRLLAVDEVERRYQISLAGVDRKEEEGTDPARDYT